MIFIEKLVNFKSPSFVWDCHIASHSFHLWQGHYLWTTSNPIKCSTSGKLNLIFKSIKFHVSIKFNQVLLKISVWPSKYHSFSYSKTQIKFHHDFHSLHDSLLLFLQKNLWFIFEAMPRELHSFIFYLLFKASYALIMLYNKQRSHCNASMRTSSAQLSVAEWK